ncbi:DUF1090 domain-containing protein [Paramixta manurensis]|uniref:DUF1090 domain-containing protein n=1 Tax=Paramixta manurensis TaxID=2740817 RepID=A0A6M8UGS1_9GAMM|nr:DUF1090 domain-containing protein [Erwiniaceae bacterium PD-1]
MKKLAILPMVMLMGFGASTLAHAGNQDCASKRAALEKEIRIAQQFGNTAKVNGLKQALAEVKAHCTSASVIADAQKDVRKLEKKLSEKQGDIREVQADLRKAQAKGDRQKIEKYQRKLSEKQADLRDIQRDLDKARAELAALQK